MELRGDKGVPKWSLDEGRDVKGGNGVASARAFPNGVWERGETAERRSWTAATNYSFAGALSAAAGFLPL